MIVFNGDAFLKPVLDSVYPYASQIVINHGCTRYWQDKGYTTSDDNTAKILAEYPDPENKLSVVNVNAEEKTGLCGAFMPLINEDTDYVWCLDSDEVFKPEHIEKTIEILKQENPASISFKSRTFFGPFSHYLTGFEREVGFKRVLKYAKGCTYVTHRAPTLSSETGRHIGADEMWKHGVEMFHYSYVMPKQVSDKIGYYESAVISKGNCIPNYFEEVWLQWQFWPEERERLEKVNSGMHEFVYPKARGECYTAVFDGEHPEVIKKDMDALLKKFHQQLDEYK